MILTEAESMIEAHQIVEREFACDHTQAIVVRFTQRNNVAVIRRQCQRCGTQVGNNLPKTEYNAATLPEWDENLRIKWNEARYQRSQELYEQQRNAKNAEWWRRYNLYLSSNHWQQLRRKVIARDHFQCQNCFCHVTEGNAQVHHLSYDGYNRIGQSFAFECVTLCVACHRSFHPENYE